ncbi:MAG: hypothetical protein IJQ85_07580 [Selenomonadaceae bacterium]|nr:hypothetical protein [Selenomonadaceae bacterium]MBR0261641.1 hypothetical protein [Selenomonadaceae bacterium]
MSETQTFDPDIIDESKPITFAPREWYFFKEEIKDQVAEGKGVDILKALHAARYYAKIDRRFERVKAGHWTEHELIEADDDE